MSTMAFGRRASVTRRRGCFSRSLKSISQRQLDAQSVSTADGNRLVRYASVGGRRGWFAVAEVAVVVGVRTAGNEQPKAMPGSEPMADRAEVDVDGNADVKDGIRYAEDAVGDALHRPAAEDVPQSQVQVCAGGV